ncbi:glycosyl transferase [Tetraselmis viridis virus SI1]|uniref:glycosyl transferase n=1 Tax=Tetraselmis viridis virus S20 TaxID=754070 RepID=UPI0002C1280B|nr:glycosyl transferase [Tetraselmis viridis virus S20]AGH31375.1 glycosyl transferase [Tetraselmis viridis virus S20]AGH31409.1 glycosyl transferase [Tetraselmis viridis virus SI1]
MTEQDTLRMARGGMSLARYGDGELKLALGRSAKSQAMDPALQRELQRVLLDTSSNCLPCIPRIADRLSPKEAFWKQYRDRRYVALYSSQIYYGSAFLTRPDSRPEIDTPAYWDGIMKLWRGRDVVLVRGSTKSLTAGELHGAASVHEIVGPRQHAWTERADLWQKLKGERRPVILCLGATATVLANWLGGAGVHALDLGHIGMFMRKRKLPGVERS